MKVPRKRRRADMPISANDVVLLLSGGEQAVRRPVGVRANASTEKLGRVFRAQHCNRRESAVRNEIKNAARLG